MRARYFLLGLLVGLLFARASGRHMWLRLRDRLATAIDSLLWLVAPRHEPAAVQRTLTPL